jgi:predicted transport protein
LLELANASSGTTRSNNKPSKTAVSIADPAAATSRSGSTDKSYAEWSSSLPPDMKNLLISLEDYIGSLGDDVQRNELKLYVAFKRLKNFATIVPQKSRLLLFLHVDPDQLPALPANARDARLFGHWGTGDLEIAIASAADLDAAKPLTLAAYEGHSS